MSKQDKKSFWRRSAKPVATPSPGGTSFQAFDSAQSDAWSDGDESSETGSQLSGLSLEVQEVLQTPRASSSAKIESQSTNTPLSSSRPRAQTSASTPTKNMKSKALSVIKGKGPKSQSILPQLNRLTCLGLLTVLDNKTSMRRTLSAPTPVASEEPAPKQETTVVYSRLEKFQELLKLPNLDLDALRELSWSGIPKAVRPTTWMLLAGYLPANVERRETTLQRKRQEYFGFIDQYYHTRAEEGNNSKTFHQIQLDLPRTNPCATFQMEHVQRILERILYIWSIRHPGSGYVQGMNDLLVPFFTVFLTPHIDGDIEDIKNFAVGQAFLDIIEADCYWCLSILLDNIQDNYIAAQPGIQKRIQALKDLISRIDAPLHEHLTKLNIDYLHFSFRWMNCLLMRELPLNCVIRLWDTYQAEVNGFATLHLYTCAAMMTRFSAELRQKGDFQSAIMFLQQLPTTEWNDRDISLLLAEAFQLKYMFHDAQGHLT
eukprot:m.189753 g.189753  ORF g.189753 m.189753 type:complete len:487 (-) comp15633_c0_seq2:2004-3464(-)